MEIHIKILIIMNRLKILTLILSFYLWGTISVSAQNINTGKMTESTTTKTKPKTIKKPQQPKVVKKPHQSKVVKKPKPAPEPYLTFANRLDYTFHNFNEAGGDCYFEISTNAASVNVNSNATWLKAYISGTKVWLACDANTGAARSANVIINAGNKSIEIAVSQQKLIFPIIDRISIANYSDRNCTECISDYGRNIYFQDARYLSVKLQYHGLPQKQLFSTRVLLIDSSGQIFTDTSETFFISGNNFVDLPGIEVNNIHHGSLEVVIYLNEKKCYSEKIWIHSTWQGYSAN